VLAGTEIVPDAVPDEIDPVVLAKIVPNEFFSVNVTVPVVGVGDPETVAETGSD
jgi:hypothetical protein